MKIKKNNFQNNVFTIHTKPIFPILINAEKNVFNQNFKIHKFNQKYLFRANLAQG